MLWIRCVQKQGGGVDWYQSWRRLDFLFASSSSVFPRRSYVRCAGCQHWRLIAEEKWSRKLLENLRCRGTPLICTCCCQGSVGKTVRDQTELHCEAYRLDKGRKCFSKGLLDEKRRTPSCLLICMECADREKRLTAELDKADARLCACSCSTFSHTSTCTCKRDRNQTLVRKTVLGCASESGT